MDSRIPLPRQRWFAQLEVLQLGFNQISDMDQLALDRLPELKVGGIFSMAPSS